MWNVRFKIKEVRLGILSVTPFISSKKRSDFDTNVFESFDRGKL